MKEPINFSKKLFKTQFVSHTGNNYKIAVQSREGSDDGRVVWGYRIPDTTQYCLAVVIDWENERYTIKKAINGDGNLWSDDNIHKGPISMGSMKTKEAFIVWMTTIISSFEHELNQ